MKINKEEAENSQHISTLSPKNEDKETPAEAEKNSQPTLKCKLTCHDAMEVLQTGSISNQNLRMYIG